MGKRILPVLGLLGVLLCRPAFCWQMSSVRFGLNWLERHQNPNGSWSSRYFTDVCDKESGPCKSIDLQDKRDDPHGRGIDGHDRAATGLAMLAFTGFGHTHQDGEYPEYVAVMKKAAKFLKGRITDIHENTPLLDHAIATMAMTELLVLSGDMVSFKHCVEAAVDHCLRTQNADGGWGFVQGQRKSNTLVTSWMVLALKMAKASKILGYLSKPSKKELESVFQRALEWYDSATDPKTGLVRHDKTVKDRQNDGTRGLSEDYFVDGVPAWTAMGVLCRLFLGQSRQNEMVKKGIAQLSVYGPVRTSKETAADHPVNFMYLYYGSYAIFQYGGQVGLKWSQGVQKTVLQHQRKVGNGAKEVCATGSWDPQGKWTQKGGRVTATVLALLSVEFYYKK